MNHSHSTLRLLSLLFIITLGCCILEIASAKSNTLTTVAVTLESGGSPITAEQTIRFSLWRDGRLHSNEVVAGVIDTTADNYSNFQIETTLTPDSQGRLKVSLSELSGFPDITIENLFLMVEYKDSGDPVSSYTLYTDTEMQTANLDRIPLIENGELIFGFDTRNEGAAGSGFVIDVDDTSGAGEFVTLQFGWTIAETLKWDIDNSRFDISDDLHVQGNLSASGTLTIEGTTRLVGTASGSRIHAENELTSSGRLTIEMPEDSEYIRINDETNADSFGIFGGAGSPETVVSAQLGSIYVDHFTGNIYKKHSGDGTNEGWEEIAISTGASLARMTRNAGQTLSGGVPTKILFDSETYDNGGIADPDTNDRFDISNTGAYLVTTGWTTSADLDNAEYLQVCIYVNGLPYVCQRAQASANNQIVSILVKDIVDLSSGDYVEMYVEQEDSSLVTNTSSEFVPFMTVAELGLSASDVGDPGMTISDADPRYVNVTGDTMLGELVLDVNSDVVALNIDSEATTKAGIQIDTLKGSNSPHILFGSGGTFDTNLFRSAVDTLRTSDSFTIDGALSVAGGQFTVANDGTSIFNQSGNDVNFRIETDNNQNTFFVSGSTDFVGIGTSSPQQHLDVAGGMSGNLLTVSTLKNCDFIESNETGRLVCRQYANSGSFISVTTTEDSTGSDAEYDIFEDANYTDTLDYDSNGSQNVTFTSSNGRFTVTETGTYLLSLNLNADMPGDYNSDVIIRVNGTEIFNHNFYFSGNAQSHPFQVAYHLDEDDYVEFFVDSEAGQNIVSTQGTTANIVLVMKADSGGGGGGGSSTLDAAYNADTGERTITVDDGDVSWDLSGTNDFIIDLQGAGNVGIDTTAPETDLEVVGTMSGTALSVGGGNGSISAAGDAVLQGGIIANGTAVFNQNGTTTNFRIESDNQENMFYVDGTNDRVGVRTSSPQAPLHVNASGTGIHIGEGQPQDMFIVFDDDMSRMFGWDDSETALSTFDEELIFRTHQGTTPPVTCSSTYARRQWMDTDTGILYICDTSNSRNKWLSVTEMLLTGEQSSTCDSGDNLGDVNCTFEFGGALGSNNDVVGFFVPRDITITGYGFSEDNDACSSGSFDIEIWGSGSPSLDNTYTTAPSGTESIVLASSLTGEAHNSTTLNADLDGSQYVLIGLDNNCGQDIDDFGFSMTYRYRHD